MEERALVCPPRSQIGPITPEQRQQFLRNSLVAGVYEAVVDRESAYELLKQRAAQRGAPRDRNLLQLNNLRRKRPLVQRPVGFGFFRQDGVVTALPRPWPRVPPHAGQHRGPADRARCARIAAGRQPLLAFPIEQGREVVKKPRLRNLLTGSALGPPSGKIQACGFAHRSPCCERGIATYTLAETSARLGSRRISSGDPPAT